jgi:hypothetical protein
VIPLTESDIDFRETLLSFRQRLTDIEQWWHQDNEEKAKSDMLKLSNRLRGAAEYHFGDVDCFDDYFKDFNIPDSNESDHIVPEAYLMVCTDCGTKWATKKEEERKCPECEIYGNVHQQLYPGIHTVPKVEIRDMERKTGDKPE